MFYEWDFSKKYDFKEGILWYLILKKKSKSQ